jgi:hypothetical protein
MAIKYADEIAKEIEERGRIQIPDGYITGEEFENWLRNKSVKGNASFSDTYKVTEYAIAAVTTNKVFPKVFITEEEAEQFKERRLDPSHWKVVSREVTYGEWK